MQKKNELWFILMMRHRHHSIGGKNKTKSTMSLLVCFYNVFIYLLPVPINATCPGPLLNISYTSVRDANQSSPVR